MCQCIDTEVELLFNTQYDLPIGHGIRTKPKIIV